MTEYPHRVHGLAGDAIAPDWPALTAAELSALLRHYPQLGTLRGVDWHSPRPLSAACLLQTSRGVIFAKRHHQRVRSVATLREEHRFMAHLTARGMPIPDVMINAGGDTATAMGDWVYEIHARARGIDLYREAISWSPLQSVQHARRAGRMLAALHVASSDYDAAQRQTHILVARSEVLRSTDPVAALQAQWSQRPALAAYLAERDWQDEFHRLFAHAPTTLAPRLQQQPRLWTHGDWHVSNLCWSDDGADARVTAVLDFGLCAENIALFDLATAIERNAVGWLQLEHGDDIAQPQIARAVIEGYASLRPLDAGALDLLADLLPLVHVDFALSEVEYFNGILASPASADVAWNAFLLGHAAWFRTRCGEALLQSIRQHPQASRGDSLRLSQNGDSLPL